MRQMHDLLEACETGAESWAVKAPVECDHTPDHADIVAYYNAGPRALHQPRFERIRAEAADFHAHMMKTPSFVQFRMCCSANPCAQCLDVLQHRQNVDPSWHPTRVLRLLQWNDFWFPIAELRDTSLYPKDDSATPSGARDAGASSFASSSSSAIGAPAASVQDVASSSKDKKVAPSAEVHGEKDVPHPAEDNLRLRLKKAADAMAAAGEAEDFMQAHLHKVEKEKLAIELATLLATMTTAAPPRAIALLTKKGDPWATPGERAYKTFDDFCRGQRAQHCIRVPVDGSSRRLEQVLPCSRCRSIFKTPAERGRHLSHAHPKLAHAQDPHTKGPLAPGLGAYSVKGLPPVIPQRRRNAPRATDSAAGDDVGPSMDGEEIAVPHEE